MESLWRRSRNVSDRGIVTRPGDEYLWEIMKNPEKSRASIVTRTGDAGETSLLYGKRVAKSHPQVEACGVIDELTSALALAKATCSSPSRIGEMEAIQTDLIALMGEIATAPEDQVRYRESTFPKIEDSHLDRIDRLAEAAERGGLQLNGWALPGKNLHEAALEMARTAARRAERRLVGLKENGVPVRPLLLQYINRVSDLLWLLARRVD